MTFIKQASEEIKNTFIGIIMNVYNLSPVQYRLKYLNYFIFYLVST